MSNFHGKSTSLVVNSYHGRVDFLDFQASSDEVFPAPSLINPVWTESPCVLANTKSFASRCGVYALLQTVREDHVGTVDDLSLDAICGIGETLHG
jgi:hypothetical protein